VLSTFSRKAVIAILIAAPPSARERGVLLTGGSIMALVVIWARITGRARPYDIECLIFGLTLVVVSFMALRREQFELQQRERSLAGARRQQLCP